MQVPTLPGFAAPVHDAQQTFRSLLTALAHPGQLQLRPLEATASAQLLTPPTGLYQTTAAVCLTLLDFETPLWLQPGLSPDIQPWLIFHTNCPLVADPQQAAFALIHDSMKMPSLSAFQSGSAEQPEASTTLLIQVESVTQGPAVTLRGPGIQALRQIAPPVPMRFWSEWQGNYQQYPLGVDVVLFFQAGMMGLPRSTQVTIGEGVRE